VHTDLEASASDLQSALVGLAELPAIDGVTIARDRHASGSSTAAPANALVVLALDRRRAATGPDVERHPARCPRPVVEQLREQLKLIAAPNEQRRKRTEARRERVALLHTPQSTGPV